MTTHLEIELLSNDNGKSLFRSQRVRSNGKEVTTPLKALDPNKFRTRIKINTDAFGVNEIYKTISSKKAKQLLTDPDEHDSFSRNLTNLSNRGQATDLRICILKFTPDKDERFPSKDEIDLLTDVAHSFSDITPIPLLNIKINKNNFPAYVEYLQSCYDTIEEWNSKPIMGMLPRLPRELYPKLLEFYLKKQISSFCFDFDGQTPDHLKLRPIMRYLNGKKLLDQTLMYGINAKPGKALRNANVIPSKDFFAYGFGLDILGESHIGLKLPRDIIKKLEKAISNQQDNKKRLFSRVDYGYHKTIGGEEIFSSYPNDTTIKLDDILNDNQTVIQRLFNMEQQSLEARKIKSGLNTLDTNETILTYIGEKEYVKKELGRFKLATKDMSQTFLSN